MALFGLKQVDQAQNTIHASSFGSGTCCAFFSAQVDI